MSSTNRSDSHAGHGAVGLAWLLAAATLALATLAGLVVRDVDELGAELARAVLAELQENENVRKNDDPATLVIVSLGEQGLLAGTATTPERRLDHGIIGHVLVSGAGPVLLDGVHELRYAQTSTAVELLDARGQVVASVALDPPYSDAQDEPASPGWERIFLTVARALAARLR